uniref:Uncharacterized protein n=1 Tax=Nelumbo nucifera TaxID=4432 RepID=A0A822Y3J9_NELNU|nr:TPA_asm: hypothetical protein HUJ06_028310 [Nelumbo nucifera]
MGEQNADSRLIALRCSAYFVFEIRAVAQGIAHIGVGPTVIPEVQQVEKPGALSGGEEISVVGEVAFQEESMYPSCFLQQDYRRSSHSVRPWVHWTTAPANG